MNMIHKAIQFATLAHKNQFRKGTNIPYIVHPFEVAQILTDAKCNEEVIIAGLLHADAGLFLCIRKTQNLQVDVYLMFIQTSRYRKSPQVKPLFGCLLDVYGIKSL